MDDNVRQSDFTSNPSAYLRTLLQTPPSRGAVAKLAGTVANSLKDDRHAQVSVLYLQAAARHLPACSVASSGSTMSAPSAIANKDAVEEEMRATQQLFQVVEVGCYHTDPPIRPTTC
jgi:hypothetical protein